MVSSFQDMPFWLIFLKSAIVTPSHDRNFWHHFLIIIIYAKGTLCKVSNFIYNLNNFTLNSPTRMCYEISLLIAILTTTLLPETNFDFREYHKDDDREQKVSGAILVPISCSDDSESSLKPLSLSCPRNFQK